MLKALIHSLNKYIYKLSAYYEPGNIRAMNKTTKQLPACEEMPETGREHYPDLKKEKKEKKKVCGECTAETTGQEI